MLRIALLLSCGLLALIGWALASPVGGSPDDNFHMTSIWCAQGIEAGRCEEGGVADQRLVPESVANSSICFAFDSELSGLCGASDDVMVSTGHGNFTGLYPPVYYWVLSLFVGDDVAASVIAMRVFNAILAVALVGALYVLAPSRLRAPLIWGLLLSAIPMGIYLIASVNPSGWAILSAATLWASIVGYFTAPTRTRRFALGAIAVVSAVMGAGSRGDSALFVALGTVLACVLAFEPSRTWLLRAILPLAFICMGGIFYLSSSQVGSALSGEMTGERPSSVDLIGGLLRTIPQIQGLWVGNFGGQNLGWGDTTMPAGVWVTTMTLYAGVVFLGLSGRIERRKAIALALTALALIFVPSWVIVQNQVAVGEIVQPRYILPLVVIFAGIALLDSPRGPESFSFVQRWAIILGLSGANALALYATLRRYLTGIDYDGVSLDDGIEWWWDGLGLSPNTVWIASGAAFFVLLLMLMRETRRNVGQALPQAASPRLPHAVHQ